MAEFDLRALSTDFVARPSGIWDTRAPFHHFLSVYKREMRAFAMSAMVHDRMDGDLIEARSAGKTLREFMVSEGGHSSRRYWKDYELNQTATNLEGVVSGPIYSEARHDLVVAQESLRRSTVIGVFSLFEAFLHCWTLNYLLAILERGGSWTKDERQIAFGLSPVHGLKVQPTVSKLISSIKLIKQTLAAFNHVGKREEASETVRAKYSLFDSLAFWRTFRNTIVHNRGFCTPRFYERYTDYWEACHPEFTRDKFVERTRLTISPELLRRFHAVVYKAARNLEDALAELSEKRRGHPWAPDPRLVDATQYPQFAKRLLIEGDHALSYTWHSDENFRTGFKVPASPSAA